MSSPRHSLSSELPTGLRPTDHFGFSQLLPEAHHPTEQLLGFRIKHSAGIQLVTDGFCWCVQSSTFSLSSTEAAEVASISLYKGTLRSPVVRYTDTIWRSHYRGVRVAWVVPRLRI